VTKTVVAGRYGGPEVLELHDIVLPQPGAGQVLIDVKAAGANQIDYKLYSGLPGHRSGGTARAGRPGGVRRGRRCGCGHHRVHRPA